jgi:hypothetical protein
LFATGGKFAAGVVDTNDNLPPASLTPVVNLPPVSLTPVANLPPVSTILAKVVEKFAAGLVDTGGKFATGVVDIGGAPWIAEYVREFSKKFEMVLLEYSGAGGKLIHEKNQKQKILWRKKTKVENLMLGSL